MKRKFLIDTDTASDDAVALIMALRHPEVEVAGITTVAGNVEVRQASRNALYTSELCGSSVPVFTGAEKPLKRAHWSAASVPASPAPMMRIFISWEPLREPGVRHH